MTRTIGQVGYWSGLGAAAATVAYSVVQILQVAGVLRFPVDEILIYGTSLCIVIPFILEILSFHYLTPSDRQFWTHAALIFTIIYAVFVVGHHRSTLHVVARDDARKEVTIASPQRLTSRVILGESGSPASA